MGGIVPIIFFLTFFGTIFGVAYFYYTTRNRERLSMIEKGADPAMFKTEPVSLFKKFSIKLGLLAVGAGIGVLAGNILESVTPLDNDVAYFSMIFIFAGSGLIASYFVARKVKD